MEYTKGFKFRIYPNVEQQKIINQTLGCARFVYNHFLAVRRDSKKKHKLFPYSLRLSLKNSSKLRERQSIPITLCDDILSIFPERLQKGAC